MKEDIREILEMEDGRWMMDDGWWKTTQDL
jgi:hypothetical protein